MSQYPPPHNPPPRWPAQYPPPYAPGYPPPHWQGMPPAPPPYGARGVSGYPIPVQSARPGIVTAVAVVSIIVACLSLVASVFTGFYGLWMFRVSQMSATINRGTSGTGSTSIVPPGMASRPGAGGTTVVPAKPVVGPEGMRETDRQTVAEVLQTMELIPPQRLRQLEWILAQSGKQVFPTGPTGASEGRVQSAVLDHGTEPSANPDAPAALYFDTPTGRLLLYDNHAVFRPSATGGRVVRSAAPAEAVGDGRPNAPGPAPGPTPGSPGGATDPLAGDPNDPFAPLPSTRPSGASGPNANIPGPGGLTPNEVQQVVQAAQKAANGRLNPAQLSAIQQALDTPGQQLVARQQVWSPVSMVQVQPDGSAVIRLGSGFLVLDAQGQVQTSMSTLMPRLAIHPLSIALVIGESIASGALAVYLLVIAILTLRESPRGRRFHQVFAAIKIPLAITGGVAFAWLMTGLLSSLRALNPGMGRGAPSANSVQVMATLGIVMAVAGLLYPVILLFVLRSKAVKDYYRPVAGG
jgi:hypothetical protein